MYSRSWNNSSSLDVLLEIIHLFMVLNSLRLITTIYIHVTKVENPGQFFVVYKQHENVLGLMTSIINKNLSNVPLRKHEATPGAFVLAPYTDNDTGSRTYYRAKIRAANIMNKTALVRKL